MMLAFYESFLWRKKITDKNLKTSKLKLSGTFCILPWIHTHNWPDGRVTPCCIGEIDKPLGNLKDSTLEEIWSNEKYKLLRTKMLNNEVPEECETCFYNEKLGLATNRLTVNKQHKKEVIEAHLQPIDKAITPRFRILYADFRFSNTCNLKCRTCNPYLSSSIESESIKHFNFNKPEKNNYIDEFKKNIDSYLKEIESIYFAGGEPLLMKGHYEIIKHLLKKGSYDVILRYSTNLTTLKQRDLDFTEVWGKFKEVHIIASLDHMERRAEYIRFGTKWNKILNVIERLGELPPNVLVSNQVTVSIYNIFKLTSFLDYLLKNSVFRYVLVNPVHGPDFMSIKLLPKKVKMNLADELRLFYSENEEQCRLKMPGVKSIIELLLEPCEDHSKLHEFFSYSSKLDEVRGDSLFDIIPELEPIYKDMA